MTGHEIATAFIGVVVVWLFVRSIRLEDDGRRTQSLAEEALRRAAKLEENSYTFAPRNQVPSLEGVADLDMRQRALTEYLGYELRYNAAGWVVVKKRK